MLGNLSKSPTFIVVVFDGIDIIILCLSLILFYRATAGNHQRS